MYRLTIAVDAIGKDDALSLDMSRELMQILLDAMTAINLTYLRRGIRFPDLLASDVRYKLEQPAPGSVCGDDDWQDIAVTFRRMFGDCDDLAPIRAAQLQHRGIVARAIALLRRSNPHTRHSRHDYHIVVMWPFGLSSYPPTVYRDPSGTRDRQGRVLLLEDPSRLKGMR